jgi:pyruvate, water dikinase
MLLRFGDDACLEVARAGGKGASLARMTGLGLPVPEGFVIPVDTLASVVDAAALRAALPDHDRAQAIVAAAEVPDEVAEAYEALGDSPPAENRPANAAVGDSPPVAVRSSACAEDSETASYAGQQETYLHVRGADAVCDRVRDCWGSFFSERAIFYRRQKGSLDDLGMAVVVQRMVRSDVAGVLFTCDPVRGRRDRMVVEAVFGLGEAAVSGQVTPDHYILKRDGSVRKAQVSQQPIAIVPADDGGVEERELGDAGAEQTLGEEHLRALARIGDDLEQRLGGPQDIEWALEGGEIYVLQARPVTT